MLCEVSQNLYALLTIEVDQKVLAEDQVHSSHRRRAELEHVELCETYALPQFPLNLVLVFVLLVEIFSAQDGVNLPQFPAVIETPSPDRKGGQADITGGDPEVVRLPRALQKLVYHHRQ